MGSLLLGAITGAAIAGWSADALSRRWTKGIGRDGTFWMYAFFGVGALAFFFVKVPETKGRSLEDIERQVEGSPGQAQQAA